LLGLVVERLPDITEADLLGRMNILREGAADPCQGGSLLANAGVSLERFVRLTIRE